MKCAKNISAEITIALMAMAIYGCSNKEFTSDSPQRKASQITPGSSNSKVGIPGTETTLPTDSPASSPSASGSPSASPSATPDGLGTNNGDGVVVATPTPLPSPISITGYKAKENPALYALLVANSGGAFNMNVDFVAEPATVAQVCTFAFQAANTPCAKVSVDYNNAFGIQGLYDGENSCGDNYAAVWSSTLNKFTVTSECQYNFTPHLDTLKWGGRISHGQMWEDRPVTCNCQQ